MPTSNDISMRFSGTIPGSNVQDRVSQALPGANELEEELKRAKKAASLRRATLTTFGALVVAAAIAVILSYTTLPLLEITGDSMEPTLSNGEYMLAVKHTGFGRGDLVAFYSDNKVLVKRVTAVAGDWVDIDSDGHVSVNGEVIDEPYIADLAYGKVSITLPYQVPDGGLFVMGDNRAISIDSRSTAVGCVYEDQIVGKLLYCVWPFTNARAL